VLFRSITGGVLSVNSVDNNRNGTTANPLGKGTNLTLDNGTLLYTGTSKYISGRNFIVTAAGGTVNVQTSTVTLTWTNISSNIYAANISGTLTKTGLGTFIFDPGYNMTISTVLAGSEGGLGHSASTSGASTLTLSGSDSNTFSGTFVNKNGGLILNKTGGAIAIAGDIIEGNLSAGGTDSTGVFCYGDNQFATTSLFTFTSSLGTAHNFSLHGTTQTIGGLIYATGTSTNAIVQNGRLNDPASADATLKLNLAAATTQTFTGSIIDHNAGSGDTQVLNIQKLGNGTQVFSGANIKYTGTTTVGAGRLKLTDATAFASNVTMNGGTLELSRTSGAWAFANNIVYGTGTGSLEKSGTGTVTMTGALSYNGAGPSYTGTTTVSGGTLQINSLFSSLGQQNLGTISGAGNLGVGDGTNPTKLGADSISVGTLTVGAGSVVTIHALAGGPTAGGSIQAVPEPSALVLLALAGLGLAGMYIRRK
jgi:fibronectin-binding autotransporter adhesin